MTPDKAIELARALARLLFAKRGNKSEMHVSEAELAAMLALAIAKGYRYGRMDS